MSAFFNWLPLVGKFSWNDRELGKLSESEMSVIYYRLFCEIFRKLILNKIFKKIFEDLLKKFVNFEKTC